MASPLSRQPGAHAQSIAALLSLIQTPLAGKPWRKKTGFPSCLAAPSFFYHTACSVEASTFLTGEIATGFSELFSL
jgi:hypothetical protein